MLGTSPVLQESEAFLAHQTRDRGGLPDAVEISATEGVEPGEQ
jgi:hypothetical protein